MNRAKYIIIDNGTTDTPIVFPVWLGHDDMARSVRRAPGSVTVLSAGFVEFYGDENGNAKCVVMGESTSLKLKPGEHDAKLIASALGLG